MPVMSPDHPFVRQSQHCHTSKWARLARGRYAGLNQQEWDALLLLRQEEAAAGVDEKGNLFPEVELTLEDVRQMSRQLAIAQAPQRYQRGSH